MARVLDIIVAPTHTPMKLPRQHPPRLTLKVAYKATELDPVVPAAHGAVVGRSVALRACRLGHSDLPSVVADYDGRGGRSAAQHRDRLVRF